MIIPIEQVAPEILENIIKEFVLREGTEYGAQDVAIADKIAQVKLQLQNGSAVLVYSELHETVNIMPKEHFNQDNHE
ncbi:YheU family protein [Thalassotalea atypica]|uniref:YheU family protein n=1 Tax=Thalassotalea atypica TaxID=2054316 RepID=UPI002573B010|nr:YheU family protein [Thalassotalea atypica]